MADAPSLFPKLADADWQRREQRIRRFEEGWRTGKRPAIEDLLPAGDADRSALLIELVHAELECRLKAGEPARVEMYLQRFPELASQCSVVLDLIAAEFELRRRDEPDVNCQHFRERFPQFDADIAAAWAADERGALALAPGEQPTALESISATPPAEGLPRFPGYEVLGLVARGDMGAIYRARQPRLDRLVAIKTMTPETEQQPAFAERFTREARALARLSHPHIIAIHDFGEADGAYFLVMEFADGANLRQLLRAGPLDLTAVLRIAFAVCDALHYAHEEGVVHRDIKPENILTDQKGRVKLVDFGLAKLLRFPDGASARHLTGPYQVMGTLHYMAPEQLYNPLHVDQRADIYSLGVVLYEMLTGELPLGLFEPPSKTHGDARLDAIILKMLEKDPERRFQNVSEVKDALQAIVPAPAASQVTVVLEELPPTQVHPPAEASGLSVGTGLRIGAMFLPVWLLTGVLANLGWPGLTAAALLMAILAFAASEWSLRYLPALRDELRQQGRAQGKVNLVLAWALFLGGFAALCGGFYTWWDQSTVDLPSMLAGYRISEQRFLHQLKAFRNATPQVELSYVTGSFALERQLALVLGISGCLLVACSLFAFLETRRYRDSWTHLWQPVLVLSLAILVPLPVVSLACGMTQFRLVQADDGSRSIAYDFRMVKVPTRQRSCDANLDQVTAVLKQWSQEHRYDLQRRGLWDLDAIPDGKTVGQLGIFEARSRSVFDHWRLTWSGPRQRTPTLKIFCLCSLDPAETVVRIDPGVVYEGSAEAEAWTPYLDSLDNALEKNVGPRN